MMLTLLALSMSSLVAAQDPLYAMYPLGPTNPQQLTAGTYNQSSVVRLALLNGYDDFCLFGPPEPNSAIGDAEPIVVAYCNKEYDDVRIIPDGAITGLHVANAKSYIQIRGYGDMTKINVKAGDPGGELDWAGQGQVLGNPHGGNVTSTYPNGTLAHYQYWSMFVGASSFCFRICTSVNPSYPPIQQCEHKIDLLGCDFNMPGRTETDLITVCDTDDALPPGIYLEPGGATSTFAQLFSSYYTDNSGATIYYTVGDSTTPAAAYSTPASSNCQTKSYVGNGISIAGAMATGTGATATGTGATATQTGATNSRTGSGTAATATNSNSANGAGRLALGSGFFMGLLAVLMI